MEMDSLDLIENYVEKGFGVGLSIRMPRRKWPSTLRLLELPDFPPVRLGIICRTESKSEPRVCRVFPRKNKRPAVAAFVRTWLNYCGMRRTSWLTWSRDASQAA